LRAKPLEQKTIPLPHEEGTEPRAALAVRLTPADGLPELWFIGTHLCHQREVVRLSQAREINKHFPADAKLPAILAGDMNARAGSTTIQEFERLWKDTLPERRKIDYVLVRKDDKWRVVETKVFDEPVASDHDPVLVVLEWQK
jgi:endonuclease/exonuclease/phosphatase family metal-dependent hydrolase